MKRRAFIERLALVPAAVTGWGSWMARAGGHPEAWTFASAPKRQVAFPFHPAEQEIIRFLRERGEAVYLHGGPVYAGLTHGGHPWTNLLLAGGDFDRVKADLFRHGVEPVSTLELQPTFIKFFWRDRLFNVIQSGVEEVCQSNYVVHKAGGLPFAHNYLAYDTDAGELHDPYEAVSGVDGLAGGIRMVVTPRTLVEAFDVVLAGHFDACLLRLQRGAGLQEFEVQILGTRCPEGQAKYVTERMLNYYPDILERLGPDTASSISQSSLVRDALKSSLGVDFGEIHEALLARIRSSASRPSLGREFMAVLHGQLGETSGPSLFASRAARFLMRNDFGVRCPEWMAGRQLA